MNTKDISTIRLNSQQITTSKFKTAKEVVSWMGAMQAQDYAMARWAVGLRLPKSTDKIIQAALDKGEIIRTHILRPTWHFVSSEDAAWILDLTAPQIKQAMKYMNKELELTDSILAKSNKILEKTLAGNKHFTREELIPEYERLKIETGNNRLSHLLLWAEQNKLICNGTVKNKRQTYALFHERIPKSKTLNRDEALAKLAGKFYTSHCPATIQDFAWWSGLSLKDARAAIEMIKSEFISETIDSKTYWFPNSFTTSSPKKKASACLLPAYDEFIISYKDRTASLPLENHKQTVSLNGIFNPTIVVNGKVVGLWKRSIKDKKLTIETNFFSSINNTVKRNIIAAANAYSRFVEIKTEVII